MQGGSRADPPRAEAPSPVSLLQGSRGSQGIGVSDCLVSPQGARCPRGLAPTAGGESNPKDVLAAGTAQHGGAQPRDSSSVPPQPAVAAGARHLLQGGWFGGFGALGVVIPHLWGKVGGSRRCGGSERGLLSWDVFSPWAVSLSPERGSPHLRWLTAIPGSRGSTWLGSRAGIIKPQAMLGRKKLLQVLGTQQNSPGEQ